MHEFYRHYLDLFARIERWPYDDILGYQAGLAEKLCRYVRDHVPVFSERVGVLFDGDEFRPERWGELAILTRRELQEATPALEAIEMPREAETLRRFATSGSTGMPVTGRRTGFSSAIATCMRERVYRWHGVDTNSSMARIFVFKSPETLWPHGRKRGGWAPSGPNGVHHQLHLLTPIERQVEWLHRTAPRYLNTSALNVHELAVAARAAGLKIEIEAIVAAGMKLFPQTRELARDVFGARTIETYGSEELGIIGIECPESGLLHVCSDHLIVEIIDEDGKPIEPGESGRVVLTGLYNYATPLLRYEIGDLAETAEEPCTCGRTLPALRRLQGRIRRTIILPDGSRVLPQTIIRALDVPNLLPTVQFQVRQTAPDSFAVFYVPAEPGTEPNEAAVRRRMREMVHPSVKIALVPVGRIHRTPSGKFEDFVPLNE